METIKRIEGYRFESTQGIYEIFSRNREFKILDRKIFLRKCSCGLKELGTIEDYHLIVLGEPCAERDRLKSFLDSLVSG